MYNWALAQGSSLLCTVLPNRSTAALDICILPVCSYISEEVHVRLWYRFKTVRSNELCHSNLYCPMVITPHVEVEVLHTANIREIRELPVN